MVKPTRRLADTGSLQAHKAEVEAREIVNFSRLFVYFHH
jgi:hypothetical protein